MDALVGLIRNGLCCIKDLRLLQQTVLWDSSVTLRYYDLPAPHNQTTPLEVMISLSQLYAFYSSVTAGFRMVLDSYGKYQRIMRLLSIYQSSSSSSSNTSGSSSSKDKDDTKPEANSSSNNRSVADKIVLQSLVKEAEYAIRSLVIGVNVFCIGVAFLWLAGTSWHVHKTNLMGGMPAVIHALIVMETCLLPLLYFMYRDGNEQIKKSKHITSLAQKVSSNDSNTSSSSDSSDIAFLTEKGKTYLGSFEALTQWVPFWDAGVHPLHLNSETVEEKLLQKEQSRVQQLVQQLVQDLGPPSSKIDDKDEKKAAQSQHLQRRQECAKELLVHARVVKYEAYREYVYFLLNTIAFYGYFMSILAYYYDDSISDKPTSVRRMLFHMESGLADWRGNFAGDLSWTVEPIIILTTPAVLQYYRKRQLAAGGTVSTGKMKSE